MFGTYFQSSSRNISDLHCRGDILMERECGKEWEEKARRYPACNHNLWWLSEKWLAWCLVAPSSSWGPQFHGSMAWTFTYSFNKYLLSTFSLLCIVLGWKHLSRDKASFLPWNLTSSDGESDHKHITSKCVMQYLTVEKLWRIIFLHKEKQDLGRKWMPGHEGAILIGLVRESLSRLRPEWGAVEKSRTMVILSSGWTLESPGGSF